jgi:hypothetical protein
VLTRYTKLHYTIQNLPLALQLMFFFAKLTTMLLALPPG